MKDLTLKRVTLALARVGAVCDAAALYAELTRVEPEYVLSEKIAEKFYKSRRFGPLEQWKCQTPEHRADLRAALDAVARDIVTELANEASSSDSICIRCSSGLYITPSKRDLIDVLCRGLPESRP